MILTNQNKMNMKTLQTSRVVAPTKNPQPVESQTVATETQKVATKSITTDNVNVQKHKANDDISIAIAINEVQKEENKNATQTKSEIVEQQLKQHDRLIITGKLPTVTDIPILLNGKPVSNQQLNGIIERYISDPQLEAAIDEAIDEQAGSGVAEANRTMHKQQEPLATETAEDTTDEDEQADQAQPADKPKDKKKIIFVILGVVALAAALFYFPKHNH